MILTEKQERFCQKKVETGNASEAYRLAYHADSMKPETVHRKAKELLDNGKIAARIEALQAEARTKHAITVDSLLAELKAARSLAETNGNPAAMITATMGKAKLLGFDKQKVEIENKDPSEDFAEWVNEISERERGKPIQFDRSKMFFK